MKNDGGPAFPQGKKENDYMGYPYTEAKGGMSMRDYFAAAALSGMHGWFGDTPIVPEVCGAIAYKIADAMIAEREK